MNAQSVNERVSKRMQCNVIYMYRYINTLCSNIFELVSVVDLSVTVGIKKLSLNLTAEHYIGDKDFKDFVENFKVSLRDSLRISTRIYLFQQCWEAVDQAKLTQQAVLLAVRWRFGYSRGRWIGTI